MKKYQILLCFVTLSLNIVKCDDLKDLVDFPCNTTAECFQFANQFIQNTTCMDKKCLCFNRNGEKITCILPDSTNFFNNVIGGGCPCLQDHAECNVKTEVCYCQRGFVASADKRRCIKREVMLGENCENDLQCIRQEKFSECDINEKRCKCQRDFVEFNSGSCISVVVLNQHCEETAQCNNKTVNSICTAKKCACDQGFVSNLEKTKCLPGADFNEACIHNNQCKLKLGAGSICYSGRCTCDINHTLLNNKMFTCEGDVHYGDYCYEHNDCYKFEDVSGHQPMECSFGECACRPDFRVINNTCVFNGASLNKSCYIFLFAMPFLCFTFNKLIYQVFF